jgi:putative ABC transport system permease protein
VSFFVLVMKGLTRNWLRTLLTMCAITVALFLFSTLQTALTSLDLAVEALGNTRLVSRNAISLIFPLPLSYAERIAKVEGVDAVTWGNWFGGQYKDRPQEFFANFAVDSEKYLEMYPEYQMPADQKAAFLSERTACIVGVRLAEAFGWKLGDNVTLTGTIYPGEFTFTIRAIYDSDTRGFDKRSMLFHWKYFDESQPPNQQGNVGWYMVRLANPNDAARVSAAIDGTFENSSARTLTESEQAFQEGFNGMLGNMKTMVYLIGISVVIAMVLVAANTMIIAGRERTRELATMKALGFDDDTCMRLLLSESLLIALIGGVLGTVVAKAIYDATKFTMGGFFPDFSVEWSTVIAGLVIATIIGLISGFVPARRAQKLRIVDALRNVG